MKDWLLKKIEWWKELKVLKNFKIKMMIINHKIVTNLMIKKVTLKNTKMK